MKLTTFVTCKLYLVLTLLPADLPLTDFTGALLFLLAHFKFWKFAFFFLIFFVNLCGILQKKFSTSSAAIYFPTPILGIWKINCFDISWDPLYETWVYWFNINLVTRLVRCELQEPIYLIGSSKFLVCSNFLKITK